MEELVGVLVSHGYGAGWSTWNDEVDPCNKELIKAFEDGLPDEDKLAIAKRLYPDAYFGGLLECSIEYLTAGTLYKITEYDGYERLEEFYNEGVRVAM